MKDNFPISSFMTTTPHTIGRDIPLNRAREMMRDRGIRHLPVLSQGKLVGVLTPRDLSLALALYPHPEALKVEDAMVDEVYAVEESAPLDEVLVTMTREKYGCAIIKDDKDRPIGIFTAIDALRLLARLLVEGSMALPVPLNLHTEKKQRRTA